MPSAAQTVCNIQVLDITSRNSRLSLKAMTSVFIN